MENSQQINSDKKITKEKNSTLTRRLARKFWLGIIVGLGVIFGAFFIVFVVEKLKLLPTSNTDVGLEQKYINKALTF